MTRINCIWIRADNRPENLFFSRKASRFARLLRAAGVRAKGRSLKTRILYQPDPEYSEATHAAGYFGDAVFSLVVTPQGKVRYVKIVTPAGFGLDEEGIKAVNEWRIEPGQKDGTPWRLDGSARWSVLSLRC